MITFLTVASIYLIIGLLFAFIVYWINNNTNYSFEILEPGWHIANILFWPFFGIIIFLVMEVFCVNGLPMLHGLVEKAFEKISDTISNIIEKEKAKREENGKH
jgi:multisubunit Na+/H+ antiporter MnhB subunit